MPWYCVQADCPYEAEDEIEAVEKYSQNYQVHYKFCESVLDEALNAKVENQNNNQYSK